MVRLHLALLAVAGTALAVRGMRLDTGRELSPRHGGQHDEMHEMHSDSSEVSEPKPTPVAHAHHQGGPAKTQLDPSLLMTDESYWDYDSTPDGHPGLIRAHIALMSIAWAALLPLSLVLRAAHHPLFVPLQLLFVGLNIVATLLARIYTSVTPEHYERDSHSRMGYAFLAYAGALLSVDIFRASKMLLAWFSGTRSPDALAHALLGEQPNEYKAVLHDEPTDSLEAEEGYWSPSAVPDYVRREPSRRDTSESVRSDDTLHDSHGNVGYHPGHSSPLVAKPTYPLGEADAPSRWNVVRKYGHIFALRLLLFMGWAELLTGIVVYTGTCKQSYINGCLAHYIKGSVFVWYGVITFSRYLGGWAELGWAWNKAPTSSWRSRMPSAEMVEASVILFYGATNTFMERFGAEPGSAFSIHELEHVSIAIMYFGAGLLGVALESKAIKRLIVSSMPTSSRPPASHGMSFNPIPALTIALTGLVMSAHHQEYAFAVSVHALWGNLLFLFGVLRFLTYTFLFLRPPTASVLPSRPPTEALAAFCLIAGGVIFMLSSEEIVFAAMRAEVADVMLFLNLTATAVSMFMTWILVLMAIKGWAYRRMAVASQRSVKSLAHA